MKTKKETLEYLGIDESVDIDDVIIETVKYFENKYEVELACGLYGYGLTCYFESMQQVLEDTDHCTLVEIESMNEITVYEIIKEDQ